ncbi:helix-turn-helix domain-containing protein [Glutamicibacter sp. NPDC087344]|uniref:helix-turn-helix domain-containing protein n=1 Tax=Glutamicibacter sp. NPDC087344 TaxID=3363994 RepID=UPI0037FFDFB8
MSLRATTQNLQVLDVTPSQHEEAAEVERRLDDVDPKTLKIRIESTSGEEIVIPSDLGKLLHQILRMAASGKSISISQITQELTSVEAAKMLGMSRPTLLKLAAQGDIEFHKVGSHSRFTRKDIRAFQEKRLEDRRRAFDELREFEDSLDLNET